MASSQRRSAYGRGILLIPPSAVGVPTNYNLLFIYCETVRLQRQFGDKLWQQAVGIFASEARMFRIGCVLISALVGLARNLVIYGRLSLDRLYTNYGVTILLGFMELYIFLRIPMLSLRRAYSKFLSSS